MAKEYVHLTPFERDIISVWLAQNKSRKEIAQLLGRDQSTIWRELNRNSSPEYKSYLAHRAQERAAQRRKKASKRPRLKNEQIVSYVTDKLSIGWSPELIAGRIKIDHPGLSISYEAIYQYIYHPKTENRDELIVCLRRSHRKRRKKGIGRKTRKTKIPNRISIDQRPSVVDQRLYYGNWEGDSVVSKKGRPVLNSLVERKSRLLFLTRVENKTALATAQTVIARLKDLPLNFRQTLTLDNGTENAGHETITSSLGIKCFFAHPYSSWERGTNENVNGLIRCYLPKGTDFSKISDKEISLIESAINNRPRKCLGFKTPIEVATKFVALQR